MTTIARGPNHELLVQSGFTRLSDYRTGNLLLLEPDTDQVRRPLVGAFKLLVAVGCFIVLSYAETETSPTYVHMMNEASLATVAIDDGHFWVSDGFVDPTGFNKATASPYLLTNKK